MATDTILYGLYFKGQKIDPNVTIVIDKVEFKLHNFLLAEKSEYFRNVLGDTYRVDDRIVIKGVAIKPFDRLIEFIYFGTKSINDDVKNNRLDDVFRTLDLAQLMSFHLYTEACAKFASEFHQNHFYGTCYAFTKKLGCSSVQKQIQRFVFWSCVLETPNQEFLCKLLQNVSLELMIDALSLNEISEMPVSIQLARGKSYSESMLNSMFLYAALHPEMEYQEGYQLAQVFKFENMPLSFIMQDIEKYSYGTPRFSSAMYYAVESFRNVILEENITILLVDKRSLIKLKLFNGQEINEAINISPMLNVTIGHFLLGDSLYLINKEDYAVYDLKKKTLSEFHKFSFPETEEKFEAVTASVSDDNICFFGKATESQNAALAVYYTKTDANVIIEFPFFISKMFAMTTNCDEVYIYNSPYCFSYNPVSNTTKNFRAVCEEPCVLSITHPYLEKHKERLFVFPLNGNHFYSKSLMDKSEDQWRYQKYDWKTETKPRFLNACSENNRLLVAIINMPVCKLGIQLLKFNFNSECFLPIYMIGESTLPNWSCFDKALLSYGLKNGHEVSE